jgi:hypothetical protein
LGADPGYPAAMLALLAHAIDRAADYARRRPLDALERGAAWAAGVVALLLMLR